jgi:MFS family permease
MDALVASVPGITSEELKRVMKLNNKELGALFSVYAFPNAVLPLLSGSFYNAAGIWRGLMIIATVIAAGVSLVAIGVQYNTFGVMLAGRVLYGLGGESLFVGVDVLATDWFKEVRLVIC